MSKWIWIGGAVLMAVAAASVYWAFQRPDFVAGLTALAVGAAWKAFAPAIAQRMSPEEEASWRQAVREGRGKEWQRDRQRRRLKEKKNG